MSESSTRIGDYEILGVLGHGGMGKVFKVRNVISDRIEAMKILLPDLAGRQELAERFLREIKLLASLNHPNIATLQTALTLNNQLVMVMEFVEGMTLSERLEKGPISSADAVNYTVQVLGALSYAHSRNVIHRDIKPANMMLTPEGVVKLMDFGIARSSGDRGLTATGTTLGSLYYMSPEQVKGETTDARSDLYSLGVSLYEMVTGQRPFIADSDYSIMAAQVQQTPKAPIELRPDLPPALNEIILTAIEKEPARRFQSADAFRNALGSLQGTLSTSIPANQDVSPIPGSISSVAGATAMLQNAGAAASINEAATATLGVPAPGVAIPSVIQLSPSPKTHRGLYMSLGALVVLVVLVVAGIYVPRKLTTRAGEQPQEIGQKSNASSAASANSSAAADADKSTAADSASANETKPQDTASQDVKEVQTSELKGGSSVPAAETAKAEPRDQTQKESSFKSGGPDKNLLVTHDAVKSTKKNAMSSESMTSNAGAVEKSASIDGGEQQAADARQGAGKPITSNAAQLEALEEQTDQLSSRANSLNDALDNLRNQQAAHGYGLRHDIASAQELMKMHLAKAQTALQNHDPAGAQKHLDLAESEAAKIDKFLGH